MRKFRDLAQDFPGTLNHWRKNERRSSENLCVYRICLSILWGNVLNNKFVRGLICCQMDESGEAGNAH
jgi:hypothetical protein